jgi:hypothetical protein
MNNQIELTNTISDNNRKLEALNRIDKLETHIDNRLLVLDECRQTLTNALELLENSNVYDELDEEISLLKSKENDVLGEIEQIHTDNELGQLMDILGVSQDDVLEAQRQDVLEGVIGVAKNV